MKSYSTTLKQGAKWYRKPAVEILIGTNLTNTLCLYKKLMNPKISITAFKENVIKGLTGIRSGSATPESVRYEEHLLIDVGRVGRRCCKKCYEKFAKTEERQVAMWKTITFNIQLHMPIVCNINYSFSILIIVSHHRQ